MDLLVCVCVRARACMRVQVNSEGYVSVLGGGRTDHLQHKM
jgi:hypothetical protein